MKKIILLPFTALKLLFGKLSWTAPGWLSAINATRKTRPPVFWGTFSVLVLSLLAYGYYQSLPKPLTIKADIETPAITPNYDNAEPQRLYIEFNYDLASLNASQQRPDGVPSVARIDLVGEEVVNGISSSPALKGKWYWMDDRRLQFLPENDWPAGTEYTLTFDKSIFIEQARLSADSYKFTTEKLTINVSEIEFYQDPQDISVRRVVSTLQFSHPVDTQSLQEKLSMSMRASGDTADKSPVDYQFSVSYDKNLREAYIQSVPVVLPDQPNYMKITLAKGVKTLLGGNDSSKEVSEKILIPDVYSFLKINEASTQIVRNEKNEPEQVLMLEFTDDIEQAELLNKLSVYLLPEDENAAGKSYWEGPGEVSQYVLQSSLKVDLRLIPNEKQSSKLYSFVFDMPEQRYLYMKIAPGLTSVNKFVRAAFYDSIVTTPEYPKEVSISGEGSVLTYSGEHKLSLQSRGVPALKYKVGRLLDGQLNHLISQSDGDMKSPSFYNWNFDASNVSAYVEKIVDIRAQHPKQASYSSLDLSAYLPSQNSANDSGYGANTADKKHRYGLFFVEVKGWDRSSGYEIYGANASRLILITDLGLIVKNNADTSHDVFVQSIQTGQPVAGATVQLLGKNGIAIFEKVTSADGHVVFPATKDFSNEKQPTVYVVKSAADISFIPFNGSSRQINLSKFDIGGVSSSHYQQETLNAFVFSDRGIYRPGETVNTGFVVKNVDLSNVQNIPLEIVVTGPRNNEVKVKKIKLAEKGLFDFQYKTDVTSDTGNYTVALHLIRDRKYRGAEIGSGSFKVEEFQPDTMKISSKLLEISDKGWSTEENIKAQISLNNLFGIPAQNRNVSGHIVIEPISFGFREYAQYTFTDPFFDKAKKPLSLDQELTEQTTDADGLASFDIDLQRFREGTYKLEFVAEGFDQAGGRSVVAANSVLISPLDYLLGYKADGKLNYINANSQRSVEFIAIDTGLNKVSRDDLVLKRVEVQQVSTLVKLNNGTYKYQSVKKEKELESSPLKIAESGYHYAIDTVTAGDYALEIVDSQNRRLSRVDYSVVGYENLAGKIDKNAELQLKLNKADYLRGEVIEMNIKAPYAGAGLISIETDRVHHFKWFKTDTQSSLQTIRIPDELEGAAYVNVAFVRDIGSKEIFTSPLSYAVAPFSIDKSNRNINVELGVKNIVRPGKPMEISYQTSRASKIVVFAVDEGILQVAKYRTPQPLAHFLKKRSLDVETLQILDLILPEFDLLKELSASGGGSDASKALAKNLNPFSRKTDKPAVYWSGIVDAGPQQQKLIFDVPDTFAGSLKIMAVAVAEESMGVSSDTAIVRGPFVISPNVLTQAAPGDEFMVTVGVANIIDGSGKNAAIELSIKSSEHLEILSPASTKLTIDEGSEGKFSFKVKAKNKPGSAELTLQAKYKNESSSRSVSLSVRPAMPYYTSLTTGFNESGDVKLDLSRNLYSELAKQSVAASASPLVLVDGLTAYLETFPHGCTEQVVSKVFPLVGLMSHPAYAPHVSNVQTHFSHVIDKLRERQLGDGGFAFWPGINDSAEYPTIYVMHFLIEAAELGYAVPTDMLERGKDYLSNYVSQSSTSIAQARNRANAIYLLTRLGMVTTNYMVDLQEYLQQEFKKTWKKDLTASYMAATYQLLQKTEEAGKLISGYTLGAVNSQTVYDDFHSGLTQDAQHIYLLSRHFETLAKALPAEDLYKLTSQIFKGEYNTISSAYSILALGAYNKLVMDNKLDEKLTFSGVLKDGKPMDLKTILEPFLTSTYPVDMQKINITGDKPLYYLNTQSGFDVDFPVKAISEGIEIHRDFLDNDGKKITSFTQGKEITVRLRVRALGDKSLSNIAVIDLLPGGFEVIRSSVSRTAYNWRADYIDVREDRVVYYGTFDSSVRDLTYKVKLTSAGDFVIPPSYAESMYDRSVRAVSVAGKFKVTAAE